MFHILLFREMTLNYENYQAKEENIPQSSFQNTVPMNPKTGLSEEASTANVVISQTGLSEDSAVQQPQFNPSMITSSPQEIVIPVVTSLSPIPQQHSDSYVTVISRKTGFNSSQVPQIASVEGTTDELGKSTVVKTDYQSLVNTSSDNIIENQAVEIANSDNIVGHHTVVNASSDNIVEHHAVVNANSDNIIQHHAVVNANGDLVIVRDAAISENSFAVSQQQQQHDYADKVS
jgi:hypothetical protein